jgi:hypothetical protein
LFKCSCSIPKTQTAYMTIIKTPMLICGIEVRIQFRNYCSKGFFSHTYSRNMNFNIYYRKFPFCLILLVFDLLCTKKFVPRTLQRMVEMIYSMRYFSFLQNNSPPPCLGGQGGGRVGWWGGEESFCPF